MKQSAAENFVETNLTGQKNFTIKASAKAFKILSSGIYQNKIAAIIRELSCNAYDAHVAAGNQDKPFDVHMPSNFEPWFSVRDYGTGMDDAKIKKLYTTYFDSTKDQSNDFVGALGIGSKSPFSYTDNYTVIAWDGTTKRVYSCFISEDGTPSILKMATDKSDEPIGIEVRLAVKEVDARQFQNEADNIYYWFSVKPNGVGNARRYLDGEELFKDVWQLAYNNGSSNSTFKLPGIRMGQVFYSIKLTEDINNTKRTVNHRGYTITASIRDYFHYSLFYNHNIMFNVPIGAVDMTASREDLEYTKKTTEAVVDLFIKLIGNQVKACIDTVLDAESYDDANMIINSAPSFFQNILPKLTWNKLRLYGNHHLRYITNTQYVKIYDMAKSGTKDRSIGLDSIGVRKIFVVLKDKQSQGLYERIIKYMNDNVTLFTNKLIKRYDKGGIYNYYGSTKPGLEDFGFNAFKVIYMDILDKRLLKPIEKALKRAKIGYIYSSKLPNVETKAGDTTINKWDLDCYLASNNTYDSTSKSRRVVDPMKGNYYVVNSKWDVEKINTHFLPIFKMAFKLNLLQGSDGYLYSVPKRVFDDVIAAPAWKNFEDELPKTKKLITGMAESTFKQDLEDLVTYKALLNLKFKPEVIKLIGKIIPEFGAICTQYKGTGTHYNLMYNLAYVYNEILGKPKLKGNDNFVKQCVKWYNDNDLLKFLGNSYLPSNASAEDIIKPFLKGKLTW